MERNNNHTSRNNRNLKSKQKIYKSQTQCHHKKFGMVSHNSGRIFRINSCQVAQFMLTSQTCPRICFHRDLSRRLLVCQNKNYRRSSGIWEVRGHDGCYQTITIFQEFADLYLSSQLLQVQLHDGTDFVTTLSTRVILEFTLEAPKRATLSVAIPSKSVDSGR